MANPHQISALPPPNVVLIVGAASGLGHGFATHYLTQPNTIVIAADVKPINLPLPTKLIASTSLITCHVDMASEQSIDELVEFIAGVLGGSDRGSFDDMRDGMQDGMGDGMQDGMGDGMQDGVQDGMQDGMQDGVQDGMQDGMQYGVQDEMQDGRQGGVRHGMRDDVDGTETRPRIMKLDLLVQSAGIRGLVPRIVKNQPEDVAAAETLEVMDAKTMLKTYQVNTLGTFLLVQKISAAGLFHCSYSSESTDASKVVLMASRMGSLSHNTAGGAYAYRASKAALNAIVKSLAIDLPHVRFCLLHPGRVETGLTVRREVGAVEVEESVRDCLEVIDGLDGRAEEGKVEYVDRFGVGIGW